MLPSSSITRFFRRPKGFRRILLPSWGLPSHSFAFSGVFRCIPFAVRMASGLFFCLMGASVAFFCRPKGFRRILSPFRQLLADSFGFSAASGAFCVFLRGFRRILSLAFQGLQTDSFALSVVSIEPSFVLPGFRAQGTPFTSHLKGTCAPEIWGARGTEASQGGGLVHHWREIRDICFPPAYKN